MQQPQLAEDLVDHERKESADTSGVISSGGIGVCEISDGRLVDLQW